MDSQVLARAQYWATGTAFESATRSEIAALLAAGNEQEITERFYRDLEFGTGGLRGILGAGASRMNIYNVRRASCAIGRYIQEFFAADVRQGLQLKVAIAYDSRRMSQEFAKAAAETFAAMGIKTLITKELRPVPMLSFAVRHFKAQAGVCITASHNPPDYNGYKVYWATGGQVVPPHDKAIIQHYAQLTRFEDIKHVPYSEALGSGLIQELGADLDEPYLQKVASLSLNQQGREDFRIVYTPLHGAGLGPVTECLKRFGFKHIAVVPEQKEPDGRFPTVKFPNPEDPDALKMAVALADKTQADLVMGTDPDADRVGLVVRDPSGAWNFLNGNQIICLLTEYYLSSMKTRQRLPKNGMVIKTIVTTDLLSDIAQHYGVTCPETLTGFKWICQLIEDVETGKSGPVREYICGGEESFGFLASSFVRDKDAVSACAIAAEMVAYYKHQGKSIFAVLDEIFLRHGVYHESLFTITLPGKDGADTIRRMMAGMRADPPTQIDGIPVKSLRDYAEGQEKTFGHLPNPGVSPLSLPRSDVLQFLLADGTKVSVRPSGTEPKIKFYVSVKDSAAIGVAKEALAPIKKRTQERVQRIEQIFVAMAQKS